MQSVEVSKYTTTIIPQQEFKQGFFALSKIFLMGTMKLPSEGVCGQWMERFRKHSSRSMLFLCVVFAQPHLGH